MYKQMLVPLDGSRTSERGLREAISLARSLGSRLSLLHVIDAYPMFDERAAAVAFLQSMDLLRSQGNELITKAAQQAKAQGLLVAYQMREAIGERAAHVIVEEAAKQGCDLIVMGTHGRRGVNRLLMGSDAELVLRNSPVPALMVRDAEPEAK